MEFADGLRAVAMRGKFMDDACRKHPGGMAAVVQPHTDQLAHPVHHIGKHRCFHHRQLFVRRQLFQCAAAASGDQFVADQAQKDRIVRQFDASACEMEGGAIAQVCFINGVDCAVIRAISDSSSGKHSMEYVEFMPMAAATSAKVVMNFLENL